MALYAIRSSSTTGILDTSTNTARLKGKIVRLNPALELAPGDLIRIGGDSFIVKRITAREYPEVSRRGAQIIQSWDSSFILTTLGIYPGSKVIESGVGSGSMTFGILKALSGTGLLVSVDVSEEAIALAGENLRNLIGKDGLNNWRAVSGDICSIKINEKFDACILDIPNPWDALANVSGMLVPGGIICFYCPTYNQVERTYARLGENGFHFLESHELVDRNLLVRVNATRPSSDLIGHTAFLSFAMKMSGIETDGTP